MGSGRRRWKKATVEACTAIDTGDLKRLNLLVPGRTDDCGSLEWRRDGAEKPFSSVGYAITVGARRGALRLDYTLAPSNERVDYTVRLVTTRCHLGGVRWWFLCPLSKNGLACGKRVRKLYLSGRHFGCRHCHDLTYTSTQESDARVYALARSGLDAMPTIPGASVSQLGVLLKALTLLEKRCNRPL